MTANVSLARRWSAAVVTRIAVAVAAAVATLQLAAVLGGTDFGRLYLLLTVAQLVGAAAESGMPMVLARTVAIDDRRGDRGRVAVLVRLGVQRASAVGIPLGVAAGAAVGLLVDDLSVATAATLVAAWGTHLALGAVVEATMASRQRPAVGQIPRLIAWSLVIVGSLVGEPASVAAAAPLFLAGSAAGVTAALVIAWPMLRIRSSMRSRATAAYEEVRGRARHTGLVRLVNASVPVGEALLVGLVLGPAATGTIGVARSLARPLTLLGSTVATAAAPDLALAYQRGGAAELWALLARLWRRVVPLAVVAVLAIGAAAGVLAATVMEGYPALLAASAVLLAAGAVNLATGPVGVALQMADGERALVRITVCSAAVLLTFVVVGGVLGGVTGAASASLLAALVNNGWCLVELRRRRSLGTSRWTPELVA